MKIFEKIARLIFLPAELQLRALVVKQNAEEQKTVEKAAKIVEDFKKELREDPEVKSFLEDYEKKYNSGGVRFL